MCVLRFLDPVDGGTAILRKVPKNLNLDTHHCEDLLNRKLTFLFDVNYRSRFSGAMMLFGLHVNSQCRCCQ